MFSEYGEVMIYSGEALEIVKGPWLQKLLAGSDFTEFKSLNTKWV